MKLQCSVGPLRTGLILFASVLACGSAIAGRKDGKPFHPTYANAPNPGLMPETVVELDGQSWSFAVGDDLGHVRGTARQGAFPHTIRYGFAPESDLSGVDYEALRDPHSSKDVVWYKKEIVLPNDWHGAVLTLEGVDYESEVYLDGVLVRTHTGGHAPFDADLGKFLGKGEVVAGGRKHTIMIRAEDDRLRRDIAVGKQERRVNEGVIFYGNSTGAWKGAHLRKVEENYIADAKHDTTAEGLFKSDVKIAGAGKSNLSVVAEVVDRETGKVVGTGTARVAHGQARLEIKVNQPKLWYPDHPTLYDVRMKLVDSGAASGVVHDTIRSYCGFRSFAQDQGHFFLNHRPTYLRGVLNQMVFPKGLYTPETLEDNANDIRQIREHGFDFQRVHNTTPSWRDIYDMENGVLAVDPKTGATKRLGIGWALEMPSARDLRDPAALDEYVRQWKDIVNAYGHGHPGLYYFVPGNEDWGMLEDADHWAGVSDAEREAFQKKLYHATIESAPEGALVSVEDGWRQITGMQHGKPVKGVNSKQLILSAHDYRGNGRELVEAYGGVSVAAHSGTELPRNGKELILNGYEFAGDESAFMIGEFGGKSYAAPGVENVFGYGSVYRDLHEWTRDSLDQLHAIGKLGIVRGGYVYTQVRDAGAKPHRKLRPGEPAGELNGFLFANGKPKSDPHAWAKMNLGNLAEREKFLQEYLKLRPDYSKAGKLSHLPKHPLSLSPWCPEILR